MSHGSELKYLVEVSRPKLWPPLLMIVLSAYGLSGESVGVMELAVLSIFTVPGNLVVYGLNDLYDWESDRYNERKTGEDPEKRKDLLKKGIAVSALFGLGVSVASGSPNVMAGCVLWLVGSYAYSVPPVRLKERPPLDSLVNSLYVLAPGLMAFGLTDLSMPAEFLWLAAATPGVHAAATVIDYEADRKAGHTTFAVKYGREAAAVFALLSALSLLLFSPIESSVLRIYLVFAMINGIYCYLHLDDLKKLKRSAIILYVTGNLLGAGYILSVYGAI